jgi:8-oxo-dGTP diphosphatase
LEVRLLSGPPEMKTYHKIIPAIYLIFEKNGEVLLQRRLNTGYEDGNYSLVGGHFEEGEKATAAAVREAEEEIGIKITEKDLELVQLMHRLSGDQERVDFTFLVKKWTGKIKNLEPQKCDDLSWFSFDNLPATTIPCIRAVIESYQKKIPYIEFGWD